MWASKFRNFLEAFEKYEAAKAALAAKCSYASDITDVQEALEEATVKLEDAFQDAVVYHIDQNRPRLAY